MTDIEKLKNEYEQRLSQYDIRLHTLELENVRQRESIEVWRKHYIDANDQAQRFRRDNDELKETNKKLEEICNFNRESCVEKSNKIAQLIRENEEQRDDGYYLEIIDELHEKIEELNDLVDVLNEEVAEYKHLKRTLKDLVC